MRYRKSFKRAAAGQASPKDNASEARNMSNSHSSGTPAQEVPPNEMPSSDHGQHNVVTEAIPVPPPPSSTVPTTEGQNQHTNASDYSRMPPSPNPTGLRDFEGRRLYFANVCSSMSPHALHCIFRSYGPIRTFHYDITLHYGYVVYLEREQALLARYGIDGLILGSRAIRVYYPPFKPRHPTRYCYNCREMGHFIQSCPYSQYNNWEYNYSQLYNQGQPIIDNMNHPSTPMMQHFAGHVMPPPPSQLMYPSVRMPVQTPGSATLMYQPGWPGSQTHGPFMPPYMNPVQQPINPVVHTPMTPMPPYMNMSPTIQQQMHLNHHQFINQVHNIHPMQPPTLIHNQQPINQMPPMPPLMQPPASNFQPATHFAHIQQPHPQLHPNINAIIEEQANVIVQQNITPMVQQVVNQIMQDPAISSLQMMQHQNMAGSYTVNEEPETASLQSGSMTMQHGSYTAMEEANTNTNTTPQHILAQLMENLPMQDSDSECMDLGKMMQYAAQTLMEDGKNNNEEPCLKGSRHVHEMDIDMSPKQSNQRPNVSCCPVHNTPLTRAQKPANSMAQTQQSYDTKTTTIHNESTTTPKAQQYPGAEYCAPPPDQNFQTTQNMCSSAESVQMNNTGEPIENQYYPQYSYQNPYSLPSSIFFTLPPIVVNITGPGPFVTPNECPGPGEPKVNFPPPYETIPNPVSGNYDFIQENERNFREFEEVVLDDEQNYVENEREFRAQQSNIISAQIPGISGVQSSQPTSSRPPAKSPTTTKVQLGKRTLKIVRGAEESIQVYEQTPKPKMSERERQRQNRLKLSEMLMDDTDPDPDTDTISLEYENAIIPVDTQMDTDDTGRTKLIYTDLISNMSTSCGEIENLFSNLSSLVGNPFAKKCLDQIRTKSELSQQLLHKIVDKDKPADRDEILKLSNDLLKYANQKLASTSAEPICEGAVGGIRNADENIESSRSECDSRKDDSDDGNYRRKNHWKKNKKRRR